MFFRSPVGATQPFRTLRPHATELDSNSILINYLLTYIYSSAKRWYEIETAARFLFLLLAHRFRTFFHPIAPRSAHRTSHMSRKNRPSNSLIFILLRTLSKNRATR